MGLDSLSRPEFVIKWIDPLRVSQNVLLPTSKISPTVPSYWKCIRLFHAKPLMTLNKNTVKPVNNGYQWTNKFNLSYTDGTLIRAEEGP